MSLTIARTSVPALHGRGARALRAVALAMLAVGLLVPATVAAGGGSSNDSNTRAARVPFTPIAAADGAGSTDLSFQNDDGEDHFDEGDDEFDCTNAKGGADACDEDDDEDRFDDGEDRFDEGDDEFEAGCANFDDGEDRCLDDVQLQIDQPQSTPNTKDPATAAAASPDRALGIAAIASLITLGGGLLFLRRVLQ